MGIINRILLFFFSLSVAALSLVVLAACLGVLPESVWLNELQYALTRPETIAGAVVVFLIAFQLFCCSFRRTRPAEHAKGEYLVLQNEAGAVRVALDAVRRLVEQTATGLPGIRLARAKVYRVHSGRGAEAADQLKLVLDLSIGRGLNVNEVSASAAKEIREELQEVMGLSDVALDLRVTSLSDAALPSKRRVV